MFAKKAFLILAGFLILSAATSSAEEPKLQWNQWRGPNRDGTLREVVKWPSDLKPETLVKQWSVPDLGSSYSGPVVSDQFVFTTETINKTTERMSAYNRPDGKLIWKQEWPGSMTVPGFAASNGSWIRSTPTYDGESLYVAGMCDLLVCLDASTGKIRWKKDFVKDYKMGNPSFGFVCSPLVDSDSVYVQAGGGFCRLAKKTGEVVWRVLEAKDQMNGSAFSSPVFATISNTQQIVVQTRTELAGVDKATGKSIWTKAIPSFRGMNILTPTVVNDSVFTSTYGGTTQLLKIQPSAEGQRTESAWSFKYEGNMTSPVIVGDHAYLFGKDQRLSCFDLATGKQTWRTEKAFGKYWNLVANGDKILALDSRGILYLFKANPTEFELLDERKVSDTETWAHLAIVGDELLIRELNQLVSYRWRSTSK